MANHKKRWESKDYEGFTCYTTGYSKAYTTGYSKAAPEKWVTKKHTTSSGAAITHHLLVTLPTNKIAGERLECRYPNGYGASVVRTFYSYGGDEGLWELAVMECDINDESVWKITYDTYLTDDVLGRLTETDVNAILCRIQALKPRKGMEESSSSKIEPKKIPPITQEDIDALRQSYSV